MLAACCPRSAGAAATGLPRARAASAKLCRAAPPPPRQAPHGAAVRVWDVRHGAPTDCAAAAVRRAPSCSGRCGPALRWPSPAQPLRSPAACRTPRSRSVPAMASAGALPLLLPLLLPSAADAADALPTISGYWMALGLGAAGVTTTLLLTSRFLVS